MDCSQTERRRLDRRQPTDIQARLRALRDELPEDDDRRAALDVLLSDTRQSKRASIIVRPRMAVTKRAAQPAASPTFPCQFRDNTDFEAHAHLVSDAAIEPQKICPFPAEYPSAAEPCGQLSLFLEKDLPPRAGQVPAGSKSFSPSLGIMVMRSAFLTVGLCAAIVGTVLVSSDAVTKRGPSLFAVLTGKPVHTDASITFSANLDRSLLATVHKPPLNLKPGLPSHQLSPGAWLPTIQPQAVVPAATRRCVLAAYGLNVADAKLAMVPVIPAELGGIMAAPNLFPANRWYGDLKARLDKELVRLVAAHQVTANQARSALAANWLECVHRHKILNGGGGVAVSRPRPPTHRPRYRRWRSRRRIRRM